MAAGRTFQHGSSVLTRNDFIGLVTSLFRPLDREDDDTFAACTAAETGSFSVLRSADALLLRLRVALPSVTPFVSSVRLGVTGEEI